MLVVHIRLPATAGVENTQPPVSYRHRMRPLVSVLAECRPMTRMAAMAASIIDGGIEGPCIRNGTLLCAHARYVP